MVTVVGKQHAARFLNVFPETDFYCPPADVIEIESARPEQGHFNLIHHHSIYKADIYIATGSEFENRRGPTASAAVLKISSKPANIGGCRAKLAFLKR